MHKVAQVKSNFMGMNYGVVMLTEHVAGYLALLIKAEVWFDVEFIEVDETKYQDIINNEDMTVVEA